MITYKSFCHCRAIRVELMTTTDPSRVDIRLCQYSFCRAHVAISASDPDDKIKSLEVLKNSIGRYKFGTKSCDFIICRHCSVYLGAIMLDNHKTGYATTQIKHFEYFQLFTKKLRQAHYEKEGIEVRLERRPNTWTPLSIP